MTPGVDLYWIPLGSGACVVRLNGKAYEAVLAGMQRRPRADLYHSALHVYARGGRYVIEVTPVPDDRGAERGVVGTGPVGTCGAGRFRIFRYEIRCWRDGVIPDVAAAIGGPARVADGDELAERVLDIAPAVPTPVWGRDELRAGEMWNSNSVVAWLLSTAGLPMDSIAPPPGGRAPGWNAGTVVARRSCSPTTRSPRVLGVQVGAARRLR